MSKLIHILLVVLFLTKVNAAYADDKSSNEWLLKYAGKSTNELRWDKRIEPLVQRHTPKQIYKNLLGGLSGPPDPVYAIKNRFVSMSACVAHYCPMKGFFWIDIQSDTGIGAVWGDDNNDPERLLIGSNVINHDKLPAEAKLALVTWLNENNLHPQKVSFIEKAGGTTPLNSADFQPHTSFVPPLGGPSFDCLKANGKIEKAICSNATLASSDLSLSKLFSEIKNGFAELSARKQLTEFQKAWIKDRNTKCALDPDIDSCLEKSYKEQYSKLMQWLPRDP